MQYFKPFIERLIECFLTIPPISVAGYILVFKYYEKFESIIPAIGDLLKKIIQGRVAAFVCFVMMSIISSFLYRIFFVLKKQ